jgi:antitoxin component YwqK of YwqJK toxin-antitoxin module
MDRYELRENRFYLIDEELGISIEEPFQGHVYRESYSSGALFQESHYLGDLLHGPSQFYSEEGNLLVRHFFYQGKREGKGWQYYASGGLYALERYLQGKRQGKQEYYFEDGNRKSLLHYRSGLLEGEVLLFWPSGRKKREAKFIQGVRTGWDRIWEEDGTLKEEIYAG